MYTIQGIHLIYFNIQYNKNIPNKSKYKFSAFSINLDLVNQMILIYVRVDGDGSFMLYLITYLECYYIGITLHENKNNTVFLNYNTIYSSIVFIFT